MKVFITDYIINYIPLFASVVTVGISVFMIIISIKAEKEQLKIKHDIDTLISAEQEYNNKKSDNEKNIEHEKNYLHNLLELHHNQALRQADIQFWFSILAAILGFVLIIMIIFHSQSELWYEYIIKTIPGAIIEVISGLFISQARETRNRATEFFIELNYDKKIEKSIEIADSIERDEIKANVKSKIALHIIGINEKSDNE